MSTLIWVQSPLTLLASDAKPTPVLAGIVAYSGTPTVTVSDNWTPSVASPSPYSGYSVNPSTGEISINLTHTFGGWGYGINTGGPTGAADGLLELTVTVNGTDCDNTLLIAINDSYGGYEYSDVAFGYGTPAPSSRWTNIRQAVET
jgi:hypothetical protein